MEREVWRGGCGEEGVEREVWRGGCGEEGVEREGEERRGGEMEREGGEGTIFI